MYMYLSIYLYTCTYIYIYIHIYIYIYILNTWALVLHFSRRSLLTALRSRSLTLLCSLKTIGGLYLRCFAVVRRLNFAA